MSLVRAARPALSVDEVQAYRESRSPAVRTTRWVCRSAYRVFFGWWPISIPALVAMIALALLPGWLGWLLLLVAVGLGVVLIRSSLGDARQLRTTFRLRRVIEGDEARLGLAPGWGLYSQRSRQVARVIFTEEVAGGIEITLAIPAGISVDAFDPGLAARDLGGRHGELRTDPEGRPGEVIFTVIEADATRSDHQADFLDASPADAPDDFGQPDALGLPEASLHDGAAWWATSDTDAPSSDRDDPPEESRNV